MAARSPILKRIAVDLTPVLPGGENGGAKTLGIGLVEQFSRLARDCEFILLTSHRSHEELAYLESGNVRRICLDSQAGPGAVSGKLLLFGRRCLSRAIPPAPLEKLARLYRGFSERGPAGSGVLRRMEADLLFCPFITADLIEPGIPAVTIVHDLQYLWYPQFFTPAERLHRDRQFRRTCRLAARIVCISEHARRTVIDKGGLAPERVVTIYVAPEIRAAPAHPAPAEALEPLGLQPRRFLLYPANFWPHKNHELLLTAFGIYRAANPAPDLKLVLTGAPGPRRDSLIQAAGRMGLGAAVIFPGYLPAPDFAVLLHQCLAVVFPSLFEGFGIPVLEAMTAGKPVLCSHSTSLPEVAGDAALYFDPRKPGEIASAIGRIQEEPGLQNALAEKGRRRAALFGTPAQMAARYLDLFRETAALSVTAAGF